MTKKKISIDKTKLAYLLTEYVLIVAGILTAFALNAWWESNKAAEREAAYLDRLRIELKSADESFSRFTSELRGDLLAVRFVNSSLSEGKLNDDDAELFGSGLMLADVLPAIRYPIPTYQELRNTGAFRELENSELKSILSDIHMEYEYSSDQLEYFRSGLVSAKNTLNQAVQFKADSSGNRDESRFSVEYDFDALRSNRKLKNDFVEVVDTHEDWLYVVVKMHELIKRSREVIE